MHHYELCNYKTHNTPKRDQKPLHRTPNYHPSVHFRKSLKNSKPHWKFLNNCPASACYPHNDWFLAGRLLLYFLMATVPTVGGFPVCSCSCSGRQATFSSAIPLCAQLVKRSEVWYQMNSSNRCWPTIPLGIMLRTFGSLVSSSGSILELSTPSPHYHLIPPGYRWLHHRLQVRGCHSEWDNWGHDGEVTVHQMCHRLVGDHQWEKTAFSRWISLPVWLLWQY
jgi:hypothetical protein